MKNYFLFHSTSLVFKSEKIIKNFKINYKIVPTPKVDGNIYCGVCICVEEDKGPKIEKLLEKNYIEYNMV